MVMVLAPELQGDAYLCPTCESLVEHEVDCAGYPSRDKNGAPRIMVCYPPCGGADYFQCSNQACFWWYREPNRRGTTFYVHGKHDVPMGERPAWYDTWYQNYYPSHKDDDAGEDSE